MMAKTDNTSFQISVCMFHGVCAFLSLEAFLRKVKLYTTPLKSSKSLKIKDAIN
jgi:hypothetical protein